MNNDTVVSVIMPVYNAEAFVETAVKSILSQTYPNIEVICVNDCSTDNSLAVLRRLAEEDGRVKVVDSPVNVGAGAARNLGLDVATGEYITFVDSDDAIENDLYEKAMAATQNGTVDEVVWGLVEEHYNAEDKHIRSLEISPGNSLQTDVLQITEKILELENSTLFGYQWNSVYKASIIKENNIRFETSLFYEDYFFNLEFAKHITSLVTIDFIGYHYFKRVNSSITHSFTKDYFSLSYRRISDMFSFCGERNYKDPAVYNILGNRLLRYTLSAVSRNFKPEAEMDSKARKEWFANICKMPVYGELLPKCKPSNIPYSVMKFAVTHKTYLPAMVLGKIINLIG